MTENRSNSKYEILVVDDEELIRNLVVTFLFKMGYSCLTAEDGIDALEKLDKNKIDAVITDIKMPNMDGILLTGEILKKFPQIPVMVMTAFDEEYSAGTAISVGAQEFIRKPFSLDEFAIRLHKMIRDSEVLRKVKVEKNEEDNMQSLMDDLEKALKDDSSS